MYSNINARLLNVLFVEKRVVYDKKYYKDYYNYIWPCENLFIKFIGAKDSSVKLDYAKQIFEYYNIIDDIVLPSFAMNSIIKLQQTYLADDNKKYYAQDHVIHTVNTYILGIYFLFNHKIFNNKVLHQIHENSFNESFITIIKMIRLFAFYHDIGYLFESMISTDNRIKGLQDRFDQYRSINSDIIELYSNKSTAKLLVLICLIKNNNNLFSPNIIFNKGIVQWENSSKKKITVNEFDELLKRFQGFHYIDCINSFYAYKKYFSSLQELESLIVIYKNNIPFAICSYKNCSLELLANVEDCPDKNIIQQINKTHNIQDIEFRIFVKNPENEIKKVFETADCFEYQNLDEFYQSIPKQISSSISLISNEHQLNDALHYVITWINNISNLPSIEEQRNELLKQALSYNIKSAIDRFLDDKKTSLYKKSLKQSINRVADLIKRLDINEIEKYINDYSNNNDGGSEAVSYYQKSFINSIKETINVNSWSSMEICDDSLMFTPFAHSDTCRVAVEIYSRIITLAKQLEIPINDLRNYKTDYTACDHGVVSASILFQVSTMYYELLENNNEYKQILFSYNSDFFEPTNRNNYIDSLAQVIFSILLHNIYTEKANKSYGIKYQHDINKNPFSYFCAFIDSIQKWDRPKQLDFSVTNLPQDHLLDDNFDLSISNDNIFIICESSYLGRMRKEIDSLETFLPGISSIVKISETEI